MSKSSELYYNLAAAAKKLHIDPSDFLTLKVPITSINGEQMISQEVVNSILNSRADILCVSCRQDSRFQILASDLSKARVSLTDLRKRIAELKLENERLRKVPLSTRKARRKNNLEKEVMTLKDENEHLHSKIRELENMVASGGQPEIPQSYANQPTTPLKEKSRQEENSQNLLFLGKAEAAPDQNRSLVRKIHALENKNKYLIEIIGDRDQEISILEEEILFIKKQSVALEKDRRILSDIRRLIVGE